MNLENKQSGPAAVVAVLDQAEKPQAAAAPPKRMPIADTVAEIRALYHLISDDSEIVYRYESGAWRPLTDAHLSHLILRVRPGLGVSARRDIAATLKSDSYVNAIKWGRVAEYELAVLNGVLDLRTLKLRPHRREDMLERVLPVKWNPDAKAPRWEEALAFWFPPAVDGGRIGGLQEYFGYICGSHAKYKRALLLYGESNTGKSVPAMVAKMLVGHANACQLGVEDMDDPQRRSVLKNKALNIITELSAEALIADGGFKTLVSTEEPILIDAKYKPPEMYVSTAKHVIATNNLPRLNDHTAATFNRLHIIPFDRVVPDDKQDRTLLAALDLELEGILVWAAAGARRLYERGGQWQEIAAAQSMVSAYKDEINPIRQFLQERTLADRDALIPLHTFATVFNLWSNGSRRRTVKEVGRLLRSAGYGEGVKYARFDGRVITCLQGFRFADTNPALLYAQPDQGGGEGAVTAGVVRSNEAPLASRNSEDLDADGEAVR